MPQPNRLRVSLPAVGVILTTMLAIFPASLVGGCSAPQIQNTRLGSADLVVMTDQMVESILASGRLAGRDADSDPWVVTLERVSNQTNDVLPQRELWAFMARVRASLAQSEQMRERNIRFVVPPRYAAQIEAGPDAVGPRQTPTHALTATFYAATTAGRSGRTDMYLCAFQLLDLRTSELVWEDAYETKRAVARGRLD